MRLPLPSLCALAGVLPGIARAACPPSLPLDQALTSAEAAYGELDANRFLGASNQAREALGCMDEPVSQEVAARLLRIEGLRAFLQDDRDAERHFFAEARWLQQDYRFPETLVPLGAEERRDYLAIPIEPRDTDPLPEPRRAEIWIDGTATLERPSAWPHIAQIREEGELVTMLLQPQDPFPRYAIQPERKGVSGPVALGSASGGVALVGLGMVGWAWAASGRFCQPDGARYLSDPDERAGYCGTGEPGSRGTPYQVAQVGWVVTGVGGSGVASATVWGLTDLDSAAIGARWTW